MNNKITGSYYTPKTLSDFLISHIFSKYIKSKIINILEPSCGDGQFLDSLFNTINVNDFKNINLTICDINSGELKKASKIIPNSDNINLNKINDDYLNFFLNSDKKFSLIMGNPPYVRKKYMKEEQILKCEEVHNKSKEFSGFFKSKGKINNLWTAFLEAAIMSLDEEGIVCFVIPAEMMHVNYTKELRELIRSEFQKIEVFAFNELIFDGIQQDVIALIGVKGINNREEQGVSFYQVNRLDDLKEPKYTALHSNIHRFSLDKWTNYILSDEDLDFINDLKINFQSVNFYCDKANVGIVSAANDFFILNDNEVKNHRLNEVDNLIKPIIGKGATLSNVVDFTQEDYISLLNGNKPVCFVQFRDVGKDELSDIELSYVIKGELKQENDKGELHKRYKMLKRNNWYNIPSVWTPQAFFIKRSHMFPKIVVNSANSLVTDSFYRIQIKDEYNIRNLTFSFYNSFTFVLAELEGRFYGGGVLELTPNEFKNLSIPYSKNITDLQFNTLDKMIRDNKPINSILDFTDEILFESVEVDINRLREIRLRLVNRRIKNHL